MPLPQNPPFFQLSHTSVIKARNSQPDLTPIVTFTSQDSHDIARGRVDPSGEKGLAKVLTTLPLHALVISIATNG